MSNLLTTNLEAQPEFPAQDLTDRNAEALELMIANLEVVRSIHAVAEMGAWALKVGHPSVVAGAKRVYDGAHVGAVEHGVMMFEAMYTAVVGTKASDDILVVNPKATRLFNNSIDDSELPDDMMRAIHGFKTDMPRASEVIVSASQRFIGPLTEYAILGAALEREIALDSITL